MTPLSFSPLGKYETMNEENYITIYSEYMAHGRHIENQRLSFATIYGVILVGSIALKSDPTILFQKNDLQIIFIFLSILGYLSTCVWNCAYFKFSRMAENVLKQCDSLNSIPTPFHGLTKIISAGLIFISFYSIMFSISIYQYFPAHEIKVIEYILLSSLLILMYLAYYNIFKDKIKDIIK